MITVLLVDDDKSMCDIIKHYFKKNDRYSIDLHWKSSTFEVEKLIQSEQFDLVIFDYNIDETNGIELFEACKPHLTVSKTNATIPSILLTNARDLELALEAIHCGFSDFICKTELSAQFINHAVNGLVEKYHMQLEHSKNVMELECANTLLCKKNQEIQKFYHTVAHELKTPLTAINEFANLINDGVAGEVNQKTRDAVDIILRNCTQLKRYLNDLLDASRLSTSKFTISCQPVTIDTVIHDVARSLTSEAHKLGVNINTNFSNDLPSMMIDENRMFQVISNLVTNAMKFTPSGGKIDIQAEYQVEKGVCVIKVSDTGRGIPVDEQEHIFDRLYQVKIEDTTKHAGLGLGLAICKEIVNQHEGDITVMSQEGVGTTFTILLPVRLQNNNGVSNEESISCRR